MERPPPAACRFNPGAPPLELRLPGRFCAEKEATRSEAVPVRARMRGAVKRALLAFPIVNRVGAAASLPCALAK